MIAFDEAHRRVHVPDDRRMVVILLRPYIIWLVIVVAVPILLAWLQVLVLTRGSWDGNPRSRNSKMCIGL